MFALRQAVLAFNRETGSDKHPEFGKNKIDYFENVSINNFIFRCTEYPGRCSFSFEYRSPRF